MTSPQPVSGSFQVSFNPSSIPDDRVVKATDATIITEDPPEHPTTDVTHPTVRHVGGAAWLVFVQGDHCSAGPGHPDYGTSDAGEVGPPSDADSIVVSDGGSVIIAGSVVKAEHYMGDVQYLVTEDEADVDAPSGSGSGNLLTTSGP